MNRILRLYVIREVVLSTLLTLFTIVFMMLMNQVSRLMIYLLQPSVRFSQVVGALSGFIPQLMVLAVPMAVLIGVLIGVGRMTLDREMLACKASGINLFWVFVPMIVLGLGVSLGIMGLSSKVIPRMLAHGLKSVSEMQFAVITSLEPGRFHDASDMGGGGALGGGDFEFFFRERDPKDPNLMKGITLKLEEESDAAKREKEARAKAAEKAEQARDAALAGKPAPARKAPSALDNILSTATQHKAAALSAAQPGKAPKAAAEKKMAKKETPGKKEAKEKKSSAKDEATSLSVRRNQLTLITAESGVISYSEPEPESKATDVPQREMVLKLKNGTIHQLNPDPNNRQYMVIRYAGLEKRLFTSAEIPKIHKARTTKELIQIIKDKNAKKELRRAARREVTQRFAISLASFVFVLVGIPLAIWVRPSGKSWGILMAVGLMLVYYLLMQWGLGLVEYGKPMGYFVAFSPNLLFVALGAVLWRHAVNS